MARTRIIDSLAVRLGFDTKGLKVGLKTLDRSINTAKTRMAGLADQMSQYSDRINNMRRGLDTFAMKLGAVGFGLSGALFAVGRAIYNFEQGLNELNSVLINETPQNLEKLEQQAKHLGATTVKSASDAVLAQTELARQGLKTNEILTATPQVLNLAVAGNLEMARAAQSVAATLKSYQLDVTDADRVTDVFAQTAANSAFTVGEIQSALRQVAPIAASFGVKFEQTMAALGTLRSGGLRPEQAGTALRNVIAILSERPSSRVQEGFEKLGLTWEAMSAQFQKTGDVVGVLRTLATAGLDGASSLDIFGREAGAGALLLAKAGQSVTDLQTKLENAEGSVTKMAELMQKGLPGAIQELRSVLEGLQLALGDNGLKGILEGAIRTLSNWIRKLLAAPVPIQRLIIALLLAGPAMIGLAAGIKAISASLGVVRVAILALRSLLLGSPIGLLIGAIGVAALVIIRNWEKLKPIIGHLLPLWGAAFKEIGKEVGRLVAAFVGLFTQANANASTVEVLRTALYRLTGWMARLSGRIRSVSEWVENLGPGWREFLRLAIMAIPLIIGLVGAIKLLGIIIAAFKVVWLAFNAVFIATPVGAIIAAIVAAVALLAAGVYLLVKNWSKIKAFFDRLWQGVVRAFNRGIKRLGSFLKGAGLWLLTFLMPFLAIPLLLIRAWRIFERFFPGVAQTIRDTFRDATEWVRETWQRLVAWVESMNPFKWLGNAWERVRNWVGAVDEQPSGPTDESGEVRDTWITRWWTRIKRWGRQAARWMAMAALSIFLPFLRIPLRLIAMWKNFEQYLPSIAEMVRQVFRDAGEWARTAWRGLVDWLTNIDLFGWLDGLWLSVTTWWTNLVESIRTRWAEFVESFDPMQAIRDMFANTFPEDWDPFKALRDAWDTFIAGFNPVAALRELFAGVTLADIATGIFGGGPAIAPVPAGAGPAGGEPGTAGIFSGGLQLPRFLGGGGGLNADPLQAGPPIGPTQAAVGQRGTAAVTQTVAAGAIQITISGSGGDAEEVAARVGAEVEAALARENRRLVETFDSNVVG